MSRAGLLSCGVYLFCLLESFLGIFLGVSFDVFVEG